MTPEQALKLIEETANPAKLFPGPKSAAFAYKTLLALIHPDRFPAGAARDRADKAARKLGLLYGLVDGKGPKPTAAIGPWIVEAPLTKGDLADLYLVTSEKHGDGILKIARAAADNDLMDAESRALQALWNAEPVNFHKYLPKLLDTFHASSRCVNVLDRHPGYLSLREIHQVLPAGVPFRHCVWMMNRLLSLLGFLQSHSYVHGGITPDHLLYHPESHGLILVGWCSAVPVGPPVSIAAKAWVDAKIYPEEVIRKRQGHPSVDIFMAAKSLLWAADWIAIPARFRPAFDWAMAASPGARPTAIELQDLWIRLAEQEYGKPKYIKLDLPVQ
jgi:hypothetical protein